MEAKRGLRVRAVVVASAALVVAVAVAGCASGAPDDAGADEEGVGRWRRPTDDPMRVSTGSGELDLRSGETGRFTLRVQRGLVGEFELDVTFEGAFDTAVPASELLVDLYAMAEPARVVGSVEWTPGAPTELIVRQVAGQLFVHTGIGPLPWVEFPGGADPLGVLELASAHDPARLVEVLRRPAVDVDTFEGGGLDGIDTVRHSGWVAGSAVADLDLDPELSASRYTAIGGLSADSVLDRMLRFDLWVGADGVPRRLVVEWDLDALAEVARRLDGTDDGIDRLRYRTEVEWFEVGRPVAIVVPPRHLVGVADIDRMRR